MFKYYLIVSFCTIFLVNCVYSDVPVQEDSYLNALKDSRSKADASLIRRDYSYSPEHYYETHGDFNEYNVDNSQDFQTSQDFQPLSKPSYGPPSLSYGSPQASYGPPKSEYNSAAPIYGPPPTIYINADHSLEHHHPRESWFLDKFKFKLDLFTIGKILLKLIIFKKIIKFIALICLLMFLPKLQLGKEDDEEIESDEMRRIFSDKAELKTRINEASKFAFTAFDTFTKNNEGCEQDQIWCRFQRTLDIIDTNYPYEKIVKLYLPSEKLNMPSIPLKE